MNDTFPLGGINSRTINWNTAKDSNTVISRLTFSPDAGGRRNPSTATDDIRKQGNSKLSA
jgi:hypothetical protein